MPHRVNLIENLVINPRGKSLLIGSKVFGSSYHHSFQGLSNQYGKGGLVIWAACEDLKGALDALGVH